MKSRIVFTVDVEYPDEASKPAAVETALKCGASMFRATRGRANDLSFSDSGVRYGIRWAEGTPVIEKSEKPKQAMQPFVQPTVEKAAQTLKTTNATSATNTQDPYPELSLQKTET